MSVGLSSSDIYTDVAGLQGLKHRAAKDSAAALKETAEKYEALFLQMMLKEMRKTTSGEGLFDSEQTQFYQQMFDDQIAQELAKRGDVGIADMLVRQLSPKEPPSGLQEEGPRQLDFERLRLRNIQAVVPQAPVTNAAPVADKPAPMNFDSPQDFVDQLWPLAEKQAQRLGIKPEVMLAQAALETGWGQHVVQRPDGGSSYNLFNIKADGRWSGDKAVVSTLEYRDGVAKREQAAFRAYPDFEASFADYADFLQSGDRYQGALEKAGDSAEFIRELHQAGYATDPEYPNKINRILGSDVFDKVAGEVKKSASGPLT